MIFHGPPEGGGESLDSVARQNSADSLQELRYWSDKPINRLALVGELLRRLELRGWRCRSDIGWSDYDVEIFGGNWANLQLVTTAEEHGPGKFRFSCRLRSRWSLPAKVVFWGLLGFELLLLGLMGTWLLWLWLMVLILPAWFWFLLREERKLRSIMAVFLDKFAEDQHLTQAPQPPPDEKPTQ